MGNPAAPYINNDAPCGPLNPLPPLAKQIFLKKNKVTTLKIHLTELKQILISHDY
jgi:hypothetical protein